MIGDLVYEIIYDFLSPIGLLWAVLVSGQHGQCMSIFGTRCGQRAETWEHLTREVH